MARNESTRKLRHFRVRHLVKTLRATGTASLAVLAARNQCPACLRRCGPGCWRPWLWRPCQPWSREVPAGGASIQLTVNAQIANTPDVFTRAMLAGDARAVAATYTVDGYQLPPHHPAVKGRAAIQQRYEAFFKGPVKMTAFAISPIESTIGATSRITLGLQHSSCCCLTERPSPRQASTSRFSNASKASGAPVLNAQQRRAGDAVFFGSMTGK